MLLEEEKLPSWKPLLIWRWRTMIPSERWEVPSSSWSFHCAGWSSSVPLLLPFPHQQNANESMISKSLRFREDQWQDSEEFANNEILQDSMMFRLIQISENSRKLSEEYKQAHPSIPFIAMNGLRNRIVHDYGNVDLGIVFDTLKKDIPWLFNLMVEESNW